MNEITSDGFFFSCAVIPPDASDSFPGKSSVGFRWSVYLGIIHLVSVADHQLIQSSWVLGVNEGNEPSGDEDDTCRNDSVDIDG